ncbi:MAG TPA: hypothetical protein VG890_03680 [Puia sp.]|nr:hypothetical protein [Puia sp.]
MKNPIKFVMKVFYANENYAKYGVKGMNYFMALAGATFYIMITGFLVFTALLATFPALYEFFLRIDKRISSTISGIIMLSIIFFLLRLTFSENSLKDDSFSKERVNKFVNYLLAYLIFVIFALGYLGFRFLHRYRYGY